MGSPKLGPAALIIAALIPIAHADVSKRDSADLQLSSRLEMTPDFATVRIEDGETMSHVLYAIKLKLGSKVPLYGEGGLVERYDKTTVFSGGEIEVPLSIFGSEPNSAFEARTPAQAGPPGPSQPPVLETSAKTPVLPQETKFSKWEIGVGFGFTRLDGEDRADGTRARLISKMSQNLKVARYFSLAPDFEVGARYQVSRFDFDSEALSVPLRKSFDLLSSFDMSFKKKWGATSLALSVGAEESLFYYSRSSDDITLDARPTAFGELRFATPIFEGGEGGLFIETFGKLYSASEGANYSSEEGHGYGFALRAKEFETGSSCGFEYGFRRQSTNLLSLTQPLLGLECAVRF